MPRELNPGQMTGLDDSHLITLPNGHRLQAVVAKAFADLQADAWQAGFELAIASSYRSFEHQLVIWNGKASGERPVYDDSDGRIEMQLLSPVERLHAILRFSALPGTSRHHWGTDLDVYDAGAVPADYEVQLSAREVAVGGVFDPLHSWLDERMAEGRSRGFYRPYSEEGGGVAPERWHLSHAPLSVACAELLCAETLVGCWEDATAELLLRGEIEAELKEIMMRYVSVPADWCPAPG